MTYLLDTDHITILQREAGPEYIILRARLAQHAPEELAFPIISLHEQVMGCHTYINQAQTAADLVRGYAMLATVLRIFTRAMVLPFDAAAAAVSATLVAQRVRLRWMDFRDRCHRARAGPGSGDTQYQGLRPRARAPDRRLDCLK